MIKDSGIEEKDGKKVYSFFDKELFKQLFVKEAVYFFAVFLFNAAVFNHIVNAGMSRLRDSRIFSYDFQIFSEGSFRTPC